MTTYDIRYFNLKKTMHITVYQTCDATWEAGDWDRLQHDMHIMFDNSIFYYFLFQGSNYELPLMPFSKIITIIVD